MSKQNPTPKEITIAEITQAAALLPEVLHPVKKEYLLLGSELLLLNKKTVAGQPINPKIQYLVKLPEYRPINHKDEMIKIYTETAAASNHESAYTAVCNYINKIHSQQNGKKSAKATKRG